MRRVYDGMTILMKYIHNDEKPDMSAHHDEIYCSGPHPDDLHEKDRDRLKELGWTWRGDLDCWHKFV